MVDENSLSYFASKVCTYTDSAGKPVPAPNEKREDTAGVQASSSSGISASTQESTSTPLSRSMGTPSVPRDFSFQHRRDPSAAQFASQGTQGHGFPFISEESNTHHQSFRDPPSVLEQSPPGKRSRMEDIVHSSQGSPLPAHVSGDPFTLPEFGVYRRASISTDSPRLAPQVIRELVNRESLYHIDHFPPLPHGLPSAYTELNACIHIRC